MRPKFLTTLMVMGVLCLYFITTLHADTSIQMQQLIQLKSSAAHESTAENFLSFDIEDKQIQLYVKRYTKNGRRSTEAMLGRAAYYFPIFEYYLQQQNLPEALKFLPVVESNLQEEVVSPTGAAGLWQFMPVTARHYGLRVNMQIDERRDVFKASAAAAKMLSELHDQFDDWLLALAAYNCGPYRVKKAIRKAGTRDFQIVKRFLPRQTRNYADKLIAAIYVGQNYPQFGLVAKQDKSILRTIEVEGAYSIERLAQAAQLSLLQFKQLNPKLPEYHLPEEYTSTLTLPHYAAKLLENYTSENPPQIIEVVASKGSEKYDVSNIRFWLESEYYPSTEIMQSDEPAPLEENLQPITWALIRRTGLI